MSDAPLPPPPFGPVEPRPALLRLLAFLRDGGQRGSGAVVHDAYILRASGNEAIARVLGVPVERVAGLLRLGVENGWLVDRGPGGGGWHTYALTVDGRMELTR